MAPKADGGRPYSTTGRAFATGGPGERPKPFKDGRPPVMLVRLPGKALQSLPDRLQLGGKWPEAITVGRHEDSDVVFKLPTVSKLHFQVALRGFYLPVSEGGESRQIHEAVFLRDVSSNGTLVNGRPSCRTWQWLNHGDLLGLLNPAAPDGVLNFFRVEYASHRELPSRVVRVEEPDAHPAAPPPARSAVKLLNQPFGKEIVGQIADVLYRDQDPPAVYRVKVIGFDPKKGWHKVDSKGLSLWDGEDFRDTIDLNFMYHEGDVKFVDVGDGEEEFEDEEEGGEGFEEKAHARPQRPAPRKRARGQ